jgi:UDP-glucose 4-epimerase
VRVFITGAAGFVGSFLVRRLLEAGRHSVGVLLRRPGEAWRIRPYLPGLHVSEGSLEDRAAVQQGLVSFRPEAVVHLAWRGVAGRDRNSVEQWRNVACGLELLELAAKAGARHWLGLGSQAEYGVCANRIDETVSAKPTTLYGASKLATFQLAQRVSVELGVRFAWLRLFSSYGPTDNPEWMIPYLIQQLLRRERPRLTQAEQRWDYIYVDDVALALQAVLETRDASGCFNVGSGEAISLRAIIETVRDMIDPALPLGFGEIPYRPDQVMHLEADISALTRATGWRPATTIADGLASTVTWERTRASAQPAITGARQSGEQ